MPSLQARTSGSWMVESRTTMGAVSAEFASCTKNDAVFAWAVSGGSIDPVSCICSSTLGNSLGFDTGFSMNAAAPENYRRKLLDSMFWKCIRKFLYMMCLPLMSKRLILPEILSQVP